MRWRGIFATSDVLLASGFPNFPSIPVAPLFSLHRAFPGSSSPFIERGYLAWVSAEQLLATRSSMNRRREGIWMRTLLPTLAASISPELT